MTDRAPLTEQATVATPVLAPVTADSGTGPTRPSGKLYPDIQDRSPKHYYIAEVELDMLEAGAGGYDRPMLGVAVGIALTCGVVDRTIKGLSPYNHALFVVGFWAGLLLALYSALRTFRTRSQSKHIARAVRSRPPAVVLSPTTATVVPPPGSAPRFRDWWRAARPMRRWHQTRG